MVRSTQIVRVYDSLPLAQSVDDEQEGPGLTPYKQQAKTIFRKLTPNSESRGTIESGPMALQYVYKIGSLTHSYMVHPPVGGSNSVAFLTIADRSYPRKLAFLYLDELAKEFETNYGHQVGQRNLRPYAFVGFGTYAFLRAHAQDTFMQRTKRLYADSRTAESAAGSNLDRLNEDLHDVQKIMTKNMEDLLWRGDSLDQMSNMSSSLRDESLKYRRAARKINFEAMLRQYAPIAAIAILFLLIVVLNAESEFGRIQNDTHDQFPVGFGGSAFKFSGTKEEVDPETGLPLWSATRLATLQAKLNQRLGPEYLSQRPGPGGGPKLTYIEGWKAMDLANEVFGFNGWSTSIQSLVVDYRLHQLDTHVETGKCNCGVSAVVRITLRDGTYHEDVGNCLYDRQYARDVLKVPASVAAFNASDLHRSGDHAHKPQIQQHAQFDAVGAKRPGEAHSKQQVDERARQARLRQADAARAAHRRQDAPHGAATALDTPPKKFDPLAKPEPVLDDSTPCDDDTNAEAHTMALELELEDDMLLRQSQLAQELESE
ncbi:SNAP receptor [Malassezia vespertilionis]|uniref:SNAP receptor n=1 Tax=Malassezia vespertilionis TaxID=2020962 RepID=UPI0024B0550B|nr:SNAP receptor [Malassezia vespertilionis]WFD07179.1 SNAP receptor [Malassezia vespertilionis]